MLTLRSFNTVLCCFSIVAKKKKGGAASAATNSKLIIPVCRYVLLQNYRFRLILNGVVIVTDVVVLVYLKCFINIYAFAYLLAFSLPLSYPSPTLRVAFPPLYYMLITTSKTIFT